MHSETSTMTIHAQLHVLESLASKKETVYKEMMRNKQLDFYLFLGKAENVCCGMSPCIIDTNQYVFVVTVCCVLRK